MTKSEIRINDETRMTYGNATAETPKTQRTPSMGHRFKPMGRAADLMQMRLSPSEDSSDFIQFLLLWHPSVNNGSGAPANPADQSLVSYTAAIYLQLLSAQPPAIKFRNPGFF